MSTDSNGLPTDWVSKIRSDFGPHPDVLARILEGTVAPRWRGLRINRSHDDESQTLERLETAGLAGFPSSLGSWLRIVDEATARDVARHDLATSGRVVLQSVSSVLAGIALDPRPGERVLDLCAAPGGKSALLADLADGDIDLVANDRSRARAHRMRGFLDLLGIRASIRVGPGERFDRRQDGSFDRVLVDAPCSGEGRFRRDDPDTYKAWTPKSAKRLASTQKALLHAAIRLVRPGGVVVYSTCTLGATENESVVRRALDRYGSGPTGVEPSPLPTSLPPGIPLLDCDDLEEPRRFMRRWVVDPSDDGLVRALEGFFVARLRRRTR